MSRKASAVIIVSFLLLASLACAVLVGCESKQNTGRVETTTPEAGTTPKSSESAATSPGSSQAAPESEEIETVVKVALEGARSNNPGLPELRVLEAKIVNDNYARVTVEPVDKSTDAATAYLKKVGGTWTVFDFGTGITPELYPDAPPELFK